MARNTSYRNVDVGDIRGTDRRAFLKLLGLGSAGGLTGLAGCSGGDGDGGGGDDQPGNSTDPSNPPEAPTGEVVPTLNYEPTGLDPAKFTNVSDRQVANNIFDSLMRFELGTTKIESNLAQEWSLTNDGNSIDLTLKEGVKFHEGYGEMTTNDVKAHFERIWNPSTASPVKVMLKQVGYKSIEAEDDYAFRLNFSKPAAAVPSVLAQQLGMIPSAEAVDEKGKEFSFHPIGAGPFKFQAYEPKTKIVLSAFKDYHYDARPKANKVTFRFIPEPQTAWAAFNAKEVDIKRVNNAARLQQLKKNDSVKISKAVGLITRFIGINNQVEPFTNKKVRKAMYYAANRKALVEAVFQGLSKESPTFMAPGVKFQTVEGVPQYPYDREKAKMLLEEAGYGGGFETEWWVPPLSRFTTPAKVLQEDFAQVGIDVEVLIKENGVYIPKILGGGSQEGPHDVPLFIHSRGQAPVPDFFMWDCFHSESWPPNGNNWWYYANEDVDMWLEQATTTTDEKQRAELFAKIARQIQEDAPSVWIDHEQFVYPMHKYVNGFTADPMRRVELEETWIEQ